MNKIKYLSAAVALLLIAHPVLAQQNWPARAVRVIVPYAAGGNTDFTARTVAAKLSEMWGQQVIVDNRPGGGTNIGSELAAKAVPDGYVLFMGGASNAVNMTLYAKPPYNTLRDFAPVAWCVQGAALLAAHPSLPAKNVKELVALAKSRPGQLNYGHAGLGSSKSAASSRCTVTRTMARRNSALPRASSRASSSWAAVSAASATNAAVGARPLNTASARQSRCGTTLLAPTVRRSSEHWPCAKHATVATVAKGRCSAAVRMWRA